MMKAITTLVILAAATAAYALTPAEVRFLRRIGATPKIVEVNDCEVVKIQADGLNKPRNMALVCDFPLYIHPKRTCLDETCQ